MVKGSAVCLDADCPMHEPNEVVENVIDGTIEVGR